MSKESVTKVAQPIPAIKILPPQVAKLMKEEDEETWISGEELYTEGSSDEESNKCKHEAAKASSPSTLPSKDSSLIPSTSQRSKSKADKNPRTQSPLATSSRYVLSSKSSNGSDDDDDDDDDAEISWKANRAEEYLKDEIVLLQEQYHEHEQLSRSMNELYHDCVEKLKYFENIENDLAIRQNENVLDQMKKSMEFFDSNINELNNKVESIKRQTRQVQWQNRLRLNEILKKIPPESNKLAKNTKSFMDLYNHNKTNTPPDVISRKKLETQDKNPSKKPSCVTLQLVKLLEVSSSKGEVH